MRELLEKIEGLDLKVDRELADSVLQMSERSHRMSRKKILKIQLRP